MTVKRKSVLITGFERFLDYPVNPSALLVRYMERCCRHRIDVKTHILPVTYDAVCRFAEVEFQPAEYAGVILTGLNHTLDRPVLEQRAVNRQHSKNPDNSGEIRINQPVYSTGSVFLDTIVDLETVVAGIKHSKLSPEISMHAGTFVCNTLYYAMLNRLKSSGIPCLFMHIPMVTANDAIKTLAHQVLEISQIMSASTSPGPVYAESMTTQREAEAFLYSFLNLEKRTGMAYTESNYSLDRFRRFLSRIGNPETGGRYIHVAGTKGKGAVCALTAGILSAHGLRTGLYTSPHLVNVRERIRLDGTAISQLDFVREMRFLKKILEGSGEQPRRRYRTVFELLTALAFRYFRKMHPHWIVLETGMGGRLDCTNVIDPILSVITRIDRDHTDSLGDTLTGIAREKAGIAKPDRPVILGHQTRYIRQQLQRHVRMRNTRAISAGQLIPIRDVHFLPEGTRFSARIGGNWYKTLFLGLPGVYQMENCRTALSVIHTLASMGHFKIDESALRDGLMRTRWPGRMTIIDARAFDTQADNVPVIIDGAHNPRAVRSLMRSVQILYPRMPVTVIMGVASNKDSGAMLQTIHEAGAEIMVTTYASTRACSPGELSDVARRLRISVQEAADLTRALEGVLRRNHRQRVVLVTGSLYLAGEALAAIGQEEHCLNIY